MVWQQPRCAGAAALLALVAALPPAGAVELQLGALLPFTDQAGGVYEDGMQRSVAVAYLEAARDFNARDGSLVAAFANFSDCAYTLNVSVADTGDSPGSFPSAVYDAAGAPYAYLSGRSLTTVAVAATYTGLASRLLVSSSATAAAFTNSGSFPYFARTCPVDYNAAIAVADLLHAYGYTTFGIVVDDTDPATGNVATNVASSAELRAYGISASVSVPIYDFSDADETEAMLEVLVDQGVKIIVAVVFAQNFPALVDAAEAVGLFNPKTLWIFVEFHGAARGTRIFNTTSMARCASTRRRTCPKSGPGTPGSTAGRRWIPRTTSRRCRPRAPPRLGAGYFDDAANRSLETGYAYDAVAAIGIAVCALDAAGEAEVVLADGGLFTDAVQDVDFVGVSGRVALKGTDRRPRYAPYAVTNVRANGTVDYVATVQNHSWFYNDMALPQYPFRQAVYYDGTSTIVNDTEPDCTKIGYFNRTTYTCEQCAPGSEPDGTNLYCEPCAPGYARAGGDGACGACAGDFSYQPDAGAAACLSCPVATVKLTTNAGLSADECVCMKGYYSSESTWNSTQWKRSGLPGVPCYSCPEGRDLRRRRRHAREQEGLLGHAAAAVPVLRSVLWP
ncbi:ionotropic glutamate receptor [Aureococcus anophagefferens]|nr:ionotropic glutamate receptor [Aureococcus anophagefferens]